MTGEKRIPTKTDVVNRIDAARSILGELVAAEGSSREASLAATKLDEAKHWANDIPNVVTGPARTDATSAPDPGDTPP